MTKKLFSIILLIAITQITFVFGSAIPCAPQLQKSLKAIEQLPEGKALLESVQKLGPIRIETSRYNLAQQFGAFWDPDERVIYVNFPNQKDDGKIIGSIIFELHNALANAKINHLDNLASQRKITKAKYVEAMEYLEYENSIKASKIAEKGIQMGLFPKGAHLPTYKDFNEHFHYQKVGGHSAWFARTYDELSTM
jgi:hypothetical protein